MNTLPLESNIITGRGEPSKRLRQLCLMRRNLLAMLVLRVILLKFRKLIQALKEQRAEMERFFKVNVDLFLFLYC